MRARVMTALAAAAATVAAVLVVGPGYDSARVRMLSGAAWLASVHTGQITLVDGATAEVKARVQVADPGTALNVVHQGGTTYALNRKTGRLSRVDSATEQLTTPTSKLPASDGLTVKPTPKALHAVDVHKGTVTSLDAETLAPQGEPQQLADALKPEDIVTDARGRLWAIDETGDLVWLAGGEPRRSSTINHGRLTVTRNQPAVVDPESGTAQLLDEETGAVVRTARAELHADDVVAVTGSADRSRVIIVNSTRGELVTCTFDTGTCADPVRIGAPGAELGAPVEIDDHAVVPDHSSGEAVVVDLATARVVVRRALFAQPTRFELVSHDGIVFFNDPTGNTAGVLDLAGGVRTIVKYADGPGEVTTPATPGQRPQADRVSQVGHREQKPGLGLPRPNVQPTTPDASPLSAAGASITVSPGHHGVAGDEFTLTMVLQAPVGEWTTQWRLGHDSTDHGHTIRHRWQQPGSYTVRATATFATGARVLAETTVTVHAPEAPPQVTALTVQRPKPVVGESVHFGADSTTKPDRWAWSVSRPGGALPEVTADTAEFDHAFSVPGTYTVSLTITKGTRTATSSREFTVARGTVEQWGSNRKSDLPPSAESGVMAIAAGDDHALALKSDGSVIAWGDSEHGKTDVPAEASRDVIAIAAGKDHSLALKKNGSVIAWGDNFYRQLAVPPSAKHGVIAISAGGEHSLALKQDGSVIAWGADEEGESTVPPEATGVVAIAAGSSISVALKSDGSVVRWGYHWGSGPRVPQEAMSDVVAIAAGKNVSMAVKRDGSVIGWSFSHDYDEVLSLPEEVMSGVVAVSTRTHALALKEDGSIIGWGGVSRGENVDVPPEYSANVLAVATGVYFSLALM